MPLFSERTRIVHLLRRAGFDASRAEREHYFALGLEGTIDALLNYEQAPDPVEDRIAGMTFDLGKVQEVSRWWFVRMVGTGRPLQEKMTLFWHGHLTSAAHKVTRADLMLGQNQFFRANALAPFDRIMKGITRDPAMLTWLDNRSNVKTAPNENYARELMELFTMGVGNYSERDVKEAARALTGMGIRRDGTYVFNVRLHDDGAKTFLGQTGPFGADDIIDIICRQAVTPSFLSRKLFEFFAHEKPTDADIGPMVQAYWDSGYSVRDMMRALFRSEAFYSDASYRQHVKGPTEHVAGAFRLLGIVPDDKLSPRGPQLIAGMGQRLLDPPDPSGWDEGAAWISTGNLLQRVNLGATLAPLPGADAAAAPETTTDAKSILDAALDLLVDGAVSADTRSLLTAEVTATPAALRKKRALQLIMGLPEFQFA